MELCPPLNPGQLMVDTTWHFHGRSLAVGGALSVGTVIAATVVPPGRGLFTHAQGVSCGVSGDQCAPGWRSKRTWRVCWSVLSWRTVASGWGRIELVKTGVMRNGVLNALQCTPEYRLWRNRPDGRDVLLRGRLRMDRPLTWPCYRMRPRPFPAGTGYEVFAGHTRSGTGRIRTVGGGGLCRLRQYAAPT